MHILPDLPYDYAALEPYIDEATMKLHHTKHHQTYVDKLNTALEKYPDLTTKSLEDLVRDSSSVPLSVPPGEVEAIKMAVKNNGGGHYNHSLFWEILAPFTGHEPKPEGELIEAIDQTFGDYEKFKEAFKNSSLAVFGSGWTWLAVDENKELKIINLPLQDNPIMIGQKAILGLDLWEHAYYLKYQNRRPEYVDNFFQIINWAKVALLYKKAIS